MKSIVIILATALGFLLTGCGNEHIALLEKQVQWVSVDYWAGNCGDLVV